MKQWNKIKRSILRITLSVISVLGICYIGYLIWAPGEKITDGRHDLSRNGIWLQHGWLGDGAWFKRNKKDPSLFRDPKRICELANLLDANGIKYVFPHLCPCESNGNIAPLNHLQTENFLDQFENFKVIPWVGGVHNVHCFPESSKWRKNFIKSIINLFETHPRLAGVHLNIELMPSGNKEFLILLDELKTAMPNGKILSIAAYPPPTMWHPFPSVHWEKPYFIEVSKRADQIVPMMYDTSIRYSKFYQQLMAEWTSEVIEWGENTEILLGIPAYEDANTGYHHPQVENLHNSIRGIHSALSLHNELPDNYSGVSIYCEWEMDKSKWEILRNEFSTKKQKDTFYIWQRNWSKRVVEAVEQEDGLKKVYFLAGEYNKSSVSINPNWKVLEGKKVEPVPVYRIHHRINWLEKDQNKMLIWICKEFEKVKKSANSSNSNILEIQLDIDCPERLLPEYLQFLKKVKEGIADKKISITVLPCHLDNDSFIEISKLVDEYILQVHGLEYPKHISNDVSIIRKTVAMASIKKAERIGHPFKVALPTYGYELFFKKDTGKFCGIAAEQETDIKTKKTTDSRFIIPDPEIVLKARNLALKTSNCRGVIWFRLPVKGDRCSWDRNTVALIQKGSLPEINIIPEWRKKGVGLYELVLHNNGVIGRKTKTLKFFWEGNDICNYGLYPGSETESENNFSLTPPEKIICTTPNPGCSKPLAWFRNIHKFPEIKMENN